MNTHLWVQGNTTIRGPRPWIDVRAYGAKGDNFTNDRQAIQDAFDAVPFPGGQVFFPAGLYRLDGPITCNTYNRSIHVVGAGRGFCALIWDAGSVGGLHFDFVNSWNRLTLHSLALVTKASSGDIALKASWPFWNGGESTGPHIYDVHISAESGGYWTKGVEMNHASGARIHDFDIFGYATPDNMTHGIHLLNSSSIVKIYSGHILYPGIGVLIQGIAEGAYISDVEAVVANIGFYLDSPVGVYPGTAIRDCHTAAFEKGIYLYQHNDVALTGNLIYQQDAAENNNFMGIHVIHSPFTRIIGNNLHGGTHNRNGIVLEGSSANCTIQGNVVRNMQTGIWLVGGGTDNNVVLGNRIVNPSLNSILNSGAGNLIPPGMNL